MHHHYHEAIQMETTRVKTWKRLNDRFVHVVLSLPSNPMHNDLLYVAPVYCKTLLYPCNMWRTCILNIHCMWVCGNTVLFVGDVSMGYLV